MSYGGNMNLFVTHSCPKKSAKYLDDKRVVKMLLETAQLLCTTAWELGIEAPYKPTHKNHPVTKWVRESRANFIWTCQYFAALSDQYLCRYGKFHKSYITVLERGVLTTVAMTGNFDKESLTDFANCAANSTNL